MWPFSRKRSNAMEQVCKDIGQTKRNMEQVCDTMRECIDVAKHMLNLNLRNNENAKNDPDVMAWLIEHEHDDPIIENMPDGMFSVTYKKELGRPAWRFLIPNPSYVNH